MPGRCPFSGCQPALRLRRPASDRMDARTVDRDRGVALQPIVVVEGTKPRLEQCRPPAVVGLQRDRAEDAGGFVAVSGRVRVPERRLGVVV